MTPMTKKTTPPPDKTRHSTSFRFDEHDLELIRQLAELLKCGQRSVLSLALRGLARREGLKVAP